LLAPLNSPWQVIAGIEPIDWKIDIPI